MAGSITIENVRVRRGSFTLALNELSIRPREIFSILGTTGSGKTVLMESIAGAFPLNEGRILLDGKDVSSLPIQQRHLGILYQDYALFPHLTVAENIAYGLRHNGLSADAAHSRVADIMERFGISHLADRHPGIISGGESQRTALARALVLEPSILLLDEPFSALDPSTKLRMYDLMREVHAQYDCTIVFVTHDFNEARTLADRIGIILNGRMRVVCTPDDLFTQTDPDIRRFLGIKP
ncbi:MAG: ATP-binding cassette domain-containing protein [Eggerthellaceae bacterium]|nr:ATP-binding cassette domain-containing protein [Eggerthellaceae bacterium]